MGDDDLRDEKRVSRHGTTDGPIDGKVVRRHRPGGRGSNLIQLQIGERPWRPTPGTDVVDIYDRHDMPTTGLIKQDDRLYVFDCVDGHVSRVNFWAYAQVDAVEVSHLQDAVGDEFSRLLKEIFTDRPIVGALAVDTRIESSAPIDC
ncbi:hypothetical protein [Sphaerimonospora thailandensis]|uniref:Uncharacterized protein n=1 Tax=Sphaerimonospora thailandensis TaxID=795644 RepID=A0A8J3W1R7_9ACTN|nr:hypothetical protein [Sphaerimonospora thailandensis]GIH72363.1 hypothetical protein Mth01_46160 [Sphaerimonospora thailandensis]